MDFGYALRLLGLVAALFMTIGYGQAWALPVPRGIPATNALVQRGYLDVTLYAGVDRTGRADSTAGLQKAIDDGYQNGLAVYFPSGTYLVSNTLRRDQVWEENGCTEDISAAVYGTREKIRKAPVLVGEKGARPLIRLKDGSPGFGDPNNPKAVVHLRNYGRPLRAGVPDWMGSLDCGFGLVFRGIDIAVGSNNPGAVGIQMPSAQYSTLEDVRVNATGGYAGVRGLPTTNVVVNVEVVGGRYGVIADSCCGISLVGMYLRQQTEASLRVTTYGIVTAAGFRLEPAAGATAVAVETSTGSITLIDGTILMTNAARPVIANATKQRDVHVRNVFVKTTGVVFEKGPSGGVVAGTGTWQRVEEYAFTSPGSNPESVKLIDRVASKATRLTMHSGVAAPATDLWTRHSWRQLPWFSDADAKNVMDADIGAKGNGVADDTSAIQRAIDKHNKVFLPRGDYRLTRQLVLRKNTQLFGVSGQRSRLYADWNPNAKLTHAIKTDTAADATTYLADIAVMLPGGYERSYMGAIDWRAGKNSWARQVAADWPWEADKSSAPRSILHVGPSGGGRWYGFTSIPQWRTSHPAFRYVLVENTAQPIVFYGMNRAYPVVTDTCYR